MEFYQELLSLETELADLRPGEGVDLGAILKNWYFKGQNLGAILEFKSKFKYKSVYSWCNSEERKKQELEAFQRNPSVYVILG